MQQIPTKISSRVRNGSPFNTQTQKKWTTKCSGKHAEKHCAQSAAQELSLGTPSNPQNYGFVYTTLKSMVSFARTHRFHISTRTPQRTQNFSLGHPFGTPLASQIDKMSPKGPIKKMFKIMQILMPRCSPMDPKMTSKSV